MKLGQLLEEISDLLELRKDKLKNRCPQKMAEMSSFRLNGSPQKMTKLKENG